MADIVDWVIRPEDQAAWDRSREPDGEPYAGAWHAGSDAGIGASVPEGGRIFMRRAWNSELGGEHARWLVLELDGVRTYVMIRDGFLQLLVSREDYYPEAAPPPLTNGAAT